MTRPFVLALAVLTLCSITAARAGVVKVGLNYPKTGPYFAVGLDQRQAAEMAVAEINAGGGVLGQTIEMVWRDSRSKADQTTQNVTELIDSEGVKMVFGGSASSVAVARARRPPGGGYARPFGCPGFPMRFLGLGPT